MSDREVDIQFMLDVTTVSEIIGYRPPGDDNEYDDARRILRSDWLARVKREAKAEGWWEGVNDQWKHRPVGNRVLETDNPHRKQVTE